jgi:hypothetical protein
MGELVLFIQIFDTATLKHGTKKIDQWQTIAKLLQRRIAINVSRIRQYIMVHGPIRSLHVKVKAPGAGFDGASEWI